MPALVCAYDYDVIRQILEDRIIQTIALRHVAKSRHYEFDDLEVKAWQDIGELRPDIVSEATSLESNSTFLNEFHSEIKMWSDIYMEFVTPDSIHTMLNNSFDNLLTVVADQSSERIRHKLGIKGRNAKARQRVAVKLARDFVSKFSGIEPGRAKGVKSEPPRFSYEKLSLAVRKLGQDRIPSQSEVARYLGYKGINPDDQLRRDMRLRVAELKRHRHNDYRWKIIVKEILSKR